MQKGDLKKLLARRQEKQRRLLQNGDLIHDDRRTPTDEIVHLPGSVQSAWMHSPRTSLPSIFSWQQQQFHHVESTKNELRDKINWLNETRDSILKEKERLQKLKDRIQQRPLSPPYSEDPLSESQRDKLLETWKFQRQRAPPDRLLNGENEQDVADIISQLKQTLVSREREFSSKKDAFLKVKEKQERVWKFDPTSYTPEQLKIYSWCHHIINELVDKVIDEEPLIPSPSTRNEIREQLSRERRHIITEEAALLVSEEIFLEYLYDECQLTALEVNYCNKLSFNMSHNTVLKESEVIAARSEAGRRFLYLSEDGVEREADSGVTEYKKTADRVRHLLYEFKDKRNVKASNNQWCHQQQFNDLTETPSAVPTAVSNAVQNQIIHIDFSDLHPVSLLNNVPLPTDSEEMIRNLLSRNQFSEFERQYWTALKVADISLQLPGEFVGESCLSISRNNRLLLLGTVSGHILLYQLSPPTFALLSQVIPLVQKIPPPTTPATQKKGILHQKSVNHIEFSHCCRLISAVYDSGEVIVYRLSEASNMPTFKYFHMLKSSGNFALTSNTLLPGDQILKAQMDWSPVFMLFNEDFDLLLQPRSIYIGMDSFDVLWLNLFQGESPSELNPSRLTEPNIPIHQLGNQNGMKFRTHIYHFHTAPIVLATVINANGDMLTLDSNGMGAIWILRKDNFSSSGWVTPWRQFIIKFETTRYFEDAVEVPKLFYDASLYSKGKTALSQEQLNEKELTRLAAEEEIVRLGLRHPWIQRRPTWKIPVVHFIYRDTSERVTESGAVFHDVGRNINTDELVSYKQVIYRAHPFPCSKFLASSYLRESSKLAVALLYNEYAPYYSACIEIVIISLPALRAIFPRIQVIVTPEEYSRLMIQDAFALSLTSALVPTGAEYLFLNILGRIECVSLLTGQCVMCKMTEPLRKIAAQQQKALQRGEKPASLGLILEQERYAFTNTTLINTINLDQTLTLLFHKQGGLSLRLLRFQDYSTSEVKLGLMEYLPSWKNQRMKGVDVTTPDTYIGRDPIDSSDPIVHTDAAVREILYGVMDTAIQRSLGKYNNEREKQVQNFNRFYAYANAAAKIGGFISSVN